MSAEVEGQSAEVAVTDDDALPEFTISPVVSSVVEGNPTQFRISSPTTKASPVTIRINVSQTGECDS